MRNPFLSCSILMLAGFALVRTPFNAIPSTDGKPAIVLNVTKVDYGNQYRDESLFVRLASDGKTEWDTFLVAGKHEHHLSILTFDDVASTKRRLADIDTTSFLEEMGPYNTYTDSGAELKIRLATSAGERNFSILNPWPCALPSCSLGRKRPMPPRVKALFCEVSALRARVSSEPLPALCKIEPTPLQKK